MKPILIVFQGLFLIGAISGGTAIAQSVIKVSEYAWSELTPVEKEAIQRKHVIDLARVGTFGIIIDNQGVDRSTPGTSGGAELGSRLGQAAYIDKALQGGGYSAKEQLAMGILGAIAGSALDSGPTSQYQFRYAVKFNDGNVRYFDDISNDPFRHAAGVCVSVPNVGLIDQQLCTQTAAGLRAVYLGNTQNQTPQAGTPLQSVSPSAIKRAATRSGDTPQNPASETVSCKIGNLAPVRTSAIKCEAINGEQMP